MNNGRMWSYFLKEFGGHRLTNGESFVRSSYVYDIRKWWDNSKQTSQSIHVPFSCSLINACSVFHYLQSNTLAGGLTSTALKICLCFTVNYLGNQHSLSITSTYPWVGGCLRNSKTAHSRETNWQLWTWGVGVRCLGDSKSTHGKPFKVCLANFFTDKC